MTDPTGTETPDPARIQRIRLSMIDSIGVDLGNEFAQGSPFEPFDRLYVIKTITRVLDVARERAAVAAGPMGVRDD